MGDKLAVAAGSARRLQTSLKMLCTERIKLHVSEKLAILNPFWVTIMAHVEEVSLTMEVKDLIENRFLPNVLATGAGNMQCCQIILSAIGMCGL